MRPAKKIIWIAGVLVFVLLVSFFIAEIAQQQDLIMAEIARVTAAGTQNFMRRIFEGSRKIVHIQQVTWAGHAFERGILETTQYKTDGNKDIKFIDSGFYAPSYSLPRSKLLDVNLNQKIKVKVSGIFEGNMESSNTGCTGYCITTEKYHFSEFGIYMIDENDNRQGMRLLGTRDNIVRGNTRSKYTFTELTVENTGNEIIVTDSSGFKIAYSTDFNYVSANGIREENKGSGNYGKLNKNQKWFLGINCHVNGEGSCKLDIKEIQVVN